MYGIAQTLLDDLRNFNSPILLGKTIDKDNLNVNQFAFGSDVRFKLNWFQTEGLLFCAVGDVSGIESYFFPKLFFLWGL
jgi:hypothetical protein